MLLQVANRIPATRATRFARVVHVFFFALICIYLLTLALDDHSSNAYYNILFAIGLLFLSFIPALLPPITAVVEASQATSKKILIEMLVRQCGYTIAYGAYAYVHLENITTQNNIQNLSSLPSNLRMLLKLVISQVAEVFDWSIPILDDLDGIMISILALNIIATILCFLIIGVRLLRGKRSFQG